MNFIVLDVETANPDYASICQIGVVLVRNGEIARSRSYLIDPEDEFSEVNISIHGITSEKVASQPKFLDVMTRLAPTFEPFPILHHGSLDRVAMNRAAEKYGIEPFNFRWLDTTRIVRRCWDQYAAARYGLRNLCDEFQIELDHHDALSDALATARVVLRAVDHSGTDIAGWFERINDPIKKGAGPDGSRITTKLEGNPDGPFAGETIVFTGEFSSVDNRDEVKVFAQNLGFNVGTSINKKTTILCLGGIQRKESFAGHDKSSKHRKAEELIANGADLKIIDENTFFVNYF